jgi:hypothetical protein
MNNRRANESDIKMKKVFAKRKKSQHDMTHEKHCIEQISAKICNNSRNVRKNPLKKLTLLTKMSCNSREATKDSHFFIISFSFHSENHEQFLISSSSEDQNAFAIEYNVVHETFRALPKPKIAIILNACNFFPNALSLLSLGKFRHKRW